MKLSLSLYLSLSNHISSLNSLCRTSQLRHTLIEWTVIFLQVAKPHVKKAQVQTSKTTLFMLNNVMSYSSNLGNRCKLVFSAKHPKSQLPRKRKRKRKKQLFILFTCERRRVKKSVQVMESKPNRNSGFNPAFSGNKEQQWTTNVN
ncbi:hypothetical protein L1049_020136 [Liquidambar formosana]|uniref:Uncharacterized protein n=1 Tax=Liquidambar formosana TaxID=63359 RepID=A0AAP0S7I0_LIQFO